MADDHSAARTRLRDTAFRPLGALAISLAGALFLALLTILCTSGTERVFLLYYYVPIAVPFLAYLLERAQRWETLTAVQRAIDLPVLMLALLRAVVPVPLVSGHALFLSYALLTTRGWVARVSGSQAETWRGTDSCTSTAERSTVSSWFPPIGWPHPCGIRSAWGVRPGGR